MRGNDLKFANDARSAATRAATGTTWLLLLVIAAALATAVAWASFAEVDQITTGTGKVIPSSQIQVVESLQAGTVSQIMISEGEAVKEGQPLVRIDDTGSSAKLGELRQRKLALQAELDRLKAHTEGRQSFTIPEDAPDEARPFYADQIAVFAANVRNLREKKAVRRQKLIQAQESLQESMAEANKNAALLEITKREEALMARLFRRKAVPEIDYLRIRAKSANLQGELNIWQSTRKRLEAEIEGARSSLTADESDFLAEARSRIFQVSADITIVEETMRAAADTVQRAVLRSPVDGIVNKLNVNSINQVVQPGASIVELVPRDDRLLIEARIRPQDIAFIRPGLEATIRITAYDYTRYGTLSGSVERIGADTITDENNETFYQVIVATDDVEAEQADIRVIPGMIATVDVSTGKRTVLEYLVKPILRLRDTALRDPR